MPGAQAAPAPGRYSRQEALPEIGRSGQERLSLSRVLILGCGALGSMQAELLARAGVGALRLVDRDVVELHNLQRQLLFDEEDAAGAVPKAAAAAKRIARINRHVAAEGLVLDATHWNIRRLLEGVDVALDATDNFATRHLLNDACVSLGKPWVYGGAVGVTGTEMAIRPGDGPCLRCLAPDASMAVQYTCETLGVLNTAVSLVASLQVSDALKLLVGAAADFPLRSVDAWRGRVVSVHPRRDPACPCCAGRRFDHLDGRSAPGTAVLCGRDAVQVSPAEPQDLDLGELRARLAGVGAVRGNDVVVELTAGVHRLTIFCDGRVLVHGVSDPALARSLVARYVGA